MLAGVPIKPLARANTRLGLGPEERMALAVDMARRTISALTEAGARVMVVTDDEQVAAMASAQGTAVAPDPGGGLDGAARAIVEAAEGGGWAVIHSDLPLVTAADCRALLAAVPLGGVALSPSADGGTTAVGGTVGEFRFAYGPGSFSRHLAAAAHLPHRVVVRPGFALDVDTPEDLMRARALSAD